MEKSLNEETYEKLKYDIMNFKLLPGDTISAQKVALRYDVSRTPAREAIVNLEKEGLLKIIPQSGTYVACINCRRSEQEWFVRKSLEIGMVDSLFENANDEMLNRMTELNNRLINYKDGEESLARIELDNSFHELIYECSGEMLAKNIIQTQMSHYNRIRYLAELNSAISAKTNDEHEMLIEAIRNKDKRKYLRVIKAHLNRIFDELEKLKGLYPQYFERE
jgi:DNA-binding GntR family transcriptional regulator